MTTSQLAGLTSNTPRGFAPPRAIAEAKRSVLNWLGVAIGAADHVIVDLLLELAQDRGGAGQATVLGRGGKTDVLSAALINGASSHIFDYDDTLLDTILHPTAPVLPAILAYGEWKGLDGRSQLEAFVLGVEVAQRVAQTVYPSHYDRGWHITGSVGAFGAAAATGWLMGLDAERMTMALGLAATQPVGFREMFGTHTKPYHPGKAAANGLEAALLAAKGFTSSLRAIEAQRGFAYVTSEEPKLQRLTEGWGETWQIYHNSYKPFPCGVVVHPAIDGVIRVREERGVAPADVDRIELDVHPLVLELTGKTAPRDGLEAKFSVYHCAAAALIDGKVGLHQFSDERVRAADVVDLRQRVTARVDQALAEDQVRVRAHLKGGGTAELFVEHCLGSAGNPLSDEALDRKFIETAVPVISEEAAARLITVVRGMDGAPGLEGLLGLAVRDPRSCSPC